MVLLVVASIVFTLQFIFRLVEHTVKRTTEPRALFRRKLELALALYRTRKYERPKITTSETQETEHRKQNLPVTRIGQKEKRKSWFGSLSKHTTKLKKRKKTFGRCSMFRVVIRESRYVRWKRKKKRNFHGAPSICKTFISLARNTSAALCLVPILSIRGETIPWALRPSARNSQVSNPLFAPHDGKTLTFKMR